VVICGSKCFKTSIYKIFERKSNRFIGLNEVGVSSGLSGLEKRTILENVHKMGKYNSLRIAFKTNLL